MGKRPRFKNNKVDSSPPEMLTALSTLNPLIDTPLNPSMLAKRPCILSHSTANRQVLIPTSDQHGIAHDEQGSTAVRTEQEIVAAQVLVDLLCGFFQRFLVPFVGGSTPGDGFAGEDGAQAKDGGCLGGDEVGPVVGGDGGGGLRHGWFGDGRWILCFCVCVAA